MGESMAKKNGSERDSYAKRFEYMNMGDKIEHVCIIALIALLAVTLAVALMV